MEMQGNAWRFRATHGDSGQHMGNTWRCRATYGDSGQHMQIQGNRDKVGVWEGERQEPT